MGKFPLHINFNADGDAGVGILQAAQQLVPCSIRCCSEVHSLLHLRCTMSKQSLHYWNLVTIFMHQLSHSCAFVGQKIVYSQPSTCTSALEFSIFVWMALHSSGFCILGIVDQCLSQQHHHDFLVWENHVSLCWFAVLPPNLHTCQLPPSARRCQQSLYSEL